MASVAFAVAGLVVEGPRCRCARRRLRASASSPCGHKAMAQAVACPGGLGNPFIHMRLGQCELELGNLDRAAEELCRVRPPASGKW